jgi:benzylsuccinate CoA-transferase BbsF subunit
LSSQGLFEDPHLKERNVFRQVEHPVIGPNWVIGPPWRLTQTPATIRSHGPLLGEHTDEVFKNDLGMSSEEIDRLRQEQVIY